MLKVLSTQMAYVKKLQLFLEENAAGNDKSSLPLVEPLTERETEVLHLLAGGLTYEQIASSLGVSLPTVKFHTQNIYNKLVVKNRTQAIKRGRELEIL